MIIRTDDCPYCGAEAHVCTEGHTPPYVASCSNFACGARGPHCTSEQEARRLWNLRASQYPSAIHVAGNEIAALCGCPDWEYPGQLVRDVQSLVDELSRVRQERTALAQVILYDETAETAEAAPLERLLKRVAILRHTLADFADAIDLARGALGERGRHALEQSLRTGSQPPVPSE